MDQPVVKDRLRLLLEHLGAVADPREPAKVKFPLSEVLFLVTCATIAGCDDYDEIADWGAHHVDFLRQHAEYYFGTPQEDWLRTLMNRIDPGLFETCFAGWAAALRTDGPATIALDGKTLRRSGDTATGAKPLHLVSAWASSQRLVLAQEAVGPADNECAAILAILGRLDLKGALVTIDAIATNPTVADTITQAGGDYVLALKRNQPSLHDEVERYFADPHITGLDTLTITDKDHGRIETRTYTVSHDVDWLAGHRRHPGEPRFAALKCLISAATKTEWRGKTTQDTRYYIASAALSAQHAGAAIRDHWGIESMHWVLDVTFREDQSRLRRGHGAHNMALIRRLAFNLVRAGKAKRSIKTARKAAGWDTKFLTQILKAKPC